MILSELVIHHLRNLQSLHIALNPRFNFIIGPNGCGKTSLLEALYILSCGHSFRSREIHPLISHNQSEMTIFGKSTMGDTLSIQKSGHAATLIKMNGQSCKATSELAYALPASVIYSDVFEIINAGPAVRRSVIDWGLFHVKHSYLSLLKNYKKVLKQRNALLKSRAPYQHFVPWDLQLAELADALHEMRTDYFKQFILSFDEIRPLITDVVCSIEYYKGWDKRNTGKSLELLLREQFESDLQRQYTQSGPHQADWIISTEGYQAKQILSRGQQKMILYAIKFAQANLLSSQVLFLLDDFAAELDERHLVQLFSFLSAQNGQYVLTATHLPPALLSLAPSAANIIEL